MPPVWGVKVEVVVVDVGVAVVVGVLDVGIVLVVVVLGVVVVEVAGGVVVDVVVLELHPDKMRLKIIVVARTR
jgi:hypothetical protein